jgi:hypothetical protein
MDLTVPQVCMADSALPAADAGARNDQTFRVQVPPNDDGSSDVPFQQDDDCICRCSHLLPSFFLHVENLNVLAYVTEQLDQTISLGSQSFHFIPSHLTPFHLTQNL